jgi:hypothetical protein
MKGAVKVLQRIKWIICAVVVLFLTACGGSNNAIVGEWKSKDAGIVFEFFQDGTVTWEQGGRTFTGQYKYIDNENVRLDIVGDLGARAIVLKDVSIRNNQLSVTLDGQSLVFDAAGKSTEAGTTPIPKAVRTEGGATPIPTAVGAGPNLMPNPSFENGSGNDPAQWWRSGEQSQFSPVWDKTAAHSGKRSIAVIVAKPGTSTAGAGWLSDFLRLKSASEYELSLWYRSTAPAAPPEWPYLAFLGVRNTSTSGWSIPFNFSPTNDWTFVSTTIQGDEALRLELYLTPIGDPYEGGIWIDDISIKEIVK